MVERIPYGWTCRKCPSRGDRGTIGDFVRVDYHHHEETPVEGVPAVVHVISETRTRTASIGYPERCKECHRRYTTMKRAMEAGRRLEYVRRSMKSKSKFRYLKFLTCTWPTTWETSSEPDMKTFKKKWSKARAQIIEDLGAVGGTDVIEVVSKQRDDGMWKHHIHTHGLWVAPYVKIDVLQAAMRRARVGRHEYTILRESTYERRDGTEGKKSALWNAIDYLAKYLTKCDGVKRQSWGALRSWKEHLPEGKCRTCIKSTRDVEKKEHCKCSTNGRRSQESTGHF